MGKEGNNSAESKDFGIAPAVLGICGFSGSGKTTLIESVLPDLKSMGLAVAVVKHGVHGLVVDRPGKDSYRYYEAGADAVLAHGGDDVFLRLRSGPIDLGEALRTVPPPFDLILVEGHKSSLVRKVWLEHPEDKSPASVTGLIEILPWAMEDRRERLLSIIKEEINRDFKERPLRCGLLVGGMSRRMGRPKALLETAGGTLAERSFDILKAWGCTPELLGDGPLPEPLWRHGRIPDVAGVGGPMAGVLSASRLVPDSAWIICAVDMPWLSGEALSWLHSHRKPGVWAVLPRWPGTDNIEPLLACYEPMIFPAIESLAGSRDFRLGRLASHPRVLTPRIPPELERAFTNVNTPDDWGLVTGPAD